jgi:hypothetical protein
VWAAVETFAVDEEQECLGLGIDAGYRRLRLHPGRCRPRGSPSP